MVASPAVAVEALSDEVTESCNKKGRWWVKGRILPTNKNILPSQITYLWVHSDVIKYHVNNTMTANELRINRCDFKLD